MSPPGPRPNPATGPSTAATGDLGPPELLAEARRYVNVADPTAGGSWARLAAYLTRQALEETLQLLWWSRPALATVHRATCRSQLTCLRQLALQHAAEDAAEAVEWAEDVLSVAPWISPALAAEAGWTWWSLCRICHVHAYELPPTAAELTGWIDAVDRFVTSARPVLTTQAAQSTPSAS